jgi:parvulin-like peptidyl-prolyl isomerase
LLVLSCGQPQQSAQEVARVNSTILTREMIAAQFDSARQPSATQIRLFANRWISSELLFQEAKRLGIDQSDAVQKNIAEATRQIVIAALIEKEVFADPPSSIPADRVEKYYTEHKDEFVFTAHQIQLSMVVFNNNDAAAALRAAALGDKGWTASIQNLLADPGASRSVVSISESLYYAQSALTPPELWKVATAMKPNEVSFPVKTSVGYIVLRLLHSFEKGSAMPAALAETEIRHRLSVEQRQQKYRDYIDALRRQSTVSISYTEKDSSSQ